jgi:hypothetical protein
MTEVGWFFHTAGDVIVLQARFESEDGEDIGYALHEVRAGEVFMGVPYDALKAAGAGIVRPDGSIT